MSEGGRFRRFADGEWLDTLTLVGTQILDLDQDHVATFDFHIALPGFPLMIHRAKPTRLGGSYDTDAGLFRPRLLEAYCHSCGFIETWSLKSIDEMSDPDTGELFSLEQIAARLPVARS